MAITTTVIESCDEERTLTKLYPVEHHFNEEGMVVVFKNGRNLSEEISEYKDGKLQRMVFTRKVLTEAYRREDYDSLINAAPAVTDTAVIASRHEDGQVAELTFADGASQRFTFNECKEEYQTLIDANGDTVSSTQIFFKKGVMMKVISTRFLPFEAEMVTEFFDYSFDELGHWISRKSERDGCIAIESRELTYY